MTGIVPRAVINDLLARIDIVAIIHARVPLRKSGANLSACCPFHSEKTPSFTVSARKQFYHCFGCGKHGNAISFIMEFDRLSFPETLEYLANYLGISLPKQNDKNHRQQDNHQVCYGLLAQVRDYYRQQLKGATHAQDYLKNRGLSAAIIEQYELGFAPVGWENLSLLFQDKLTENQVLQKVGILKKDEQGRTHDLFSDRIMFPIHNRKGFVIGFGGRLMKNSDRAPKYLNSPTSSVFQKGSELYGLYQIAQSRQPYEHILVVEGYMDVLALVQYGIPNVVATLGTAATAQHLERLFHETNKVIFCFDGDNAGKKAAWRALEVVLPLLINGRQVQFMFLPETDDPDSLIRKEGTDFFRERIFKATPLVDYLLGTLREQADVTSIDGRARFAQLAKPLLDLIPDKIYQQVLYDELAKITRSQIGPAASTVAHEAPRRSATHKPLNQASISLLAKATSYLLQYPELIQHVQQSQWLFDLNDPENDLFMKIMETISECPDASVAVLLEYWRDHPHLEQVARLASLEHLCPPEGIEKEFMGILKKLRHELITNQIKELYKKHESWTAEDRDCLMKLILESKELQ